MTPRTYRNGWDQLGLGLLPLSPSRSFPVSYWHFLSPHPLGSFTVNVPPSTDRQLKSLFLSYDQTANSRFSFCQSKKFWETCAALFWLVAFRQGGKNFSCLKGFQVLLFRTTSCRMILTIVSCSLIIEAVMLLPPPLSPSDHPSDRCCPLLACYSQGGRTNKDKDLRTRRGTAIICSCSCSESSMSVYVRRRLYKHVSRAFAV